MKVIEYKDKENIKKQILNKKIVLVGGCFDILHYGHIKFLQNAKKYGDFLIIALESDKFIKIKKNKKPYHDIMERSFILSSISYVDLVIKLPYFKNSKDYYDLVSFIRPKIIAITQNDPFYDDKEKQAKLVNGEIKVVSPVINKFSSTKAISYAPFSCD